MYLVDVNVLIALSDPAHPHAVAARTFFSESAVRDGWATCPLVENGFLRIFGGHKYPGGPGSPQAARVILEGILASPGHRFLPDNLSLCDTGRFPSLPESPLALTDVYLLALAVEHDVRLAILDSRIDPALVPGGLRSYYVIPPVRSPI